MNIHPLIRAFKFNVSEISEQDTEKNGGGGNTKLEESKKNNKNSTEQEGKTKSELENGESESVVEFDLENPLTYAMKALHELAVQSGRGFDIAQMSIPQLIDEKVHVKRQLRYFDNAFKAKHGSEVHITLLLFLLGSSPSFFFFCFFTS